MKTFLPMLFLAAGLCSCNTLANRRDLYSEGDPKNAHYYDAAGRNPSDDGFAEMYRKRYVRKISTPTSSEGAPSSSGYAPTTSDYAPSPSLYSPTTGDYAPSPSPSDDNFVKSFRKWYERKISTPTN